MANRKSLTRPFVVQRYVFTPAPTGSVKIHRLRLPMRFTGKDPAGVLDFATRVRGEDLAVSLDLKDGKPPVECVARIENASVRLPRGSKRPPVLVSLVVESAEVHAIQAVLEGAVRAARAQLLELEVSMRLIQESLPGMAEDEEDEEAGAPEKPAAPAAEAPVHQGPGSGRRRGRARPPAPEA